MRPRLFPSVGGVSAALLLVSLVPALVPMTAAAHPTAGAHRPSYRENRARTRHEAHRLLGLAPVPSDAQPTTDHDGIDSPLTYADGSRIDAAKFWYVDRPIRAVYRQIQAGPPPRGTQQLASGSSTASGKVTREFVDWTEPDRSYAEGLSLELTLARGPNGGTTIRGDGMGLPLDPRPIRDRAPATQRMRVTVAAGCPGSDEGKYSVRSPGSDLRHRMLPAARPSAGVVCVYSGSGGSPAFGLVRTVRLSQLRAQRLAAAIRRKVTLAHTDGVGYSCPADTGAADAIALGYPGRPDVDLYWAYQGCWSMSNGRVVAGFDTPEPSIPRRWTAP